MRRKNQRGLTLVELIVAFTIMFLLTTMAVPLARAKVRRERERDLRYALREMRTAIDKYKDYAGPGLPRADRNWAPTTTPRRSSILVEGVKLHRAGRTRRSASCAASRKDPFTGKSTEWGMRSTQDDPKSNSWGGQNVFDVYSKTMEKAPDGTPYSEW